MPWWLKKKKDSFITASCSSKYPVLCTNGGSAFISFVIYGAGFLITNYVLFLSSGIFNNNLCYALSFLILGFSVPLFEEDILFLTPKWQWMWIDPEFFCNVVRNRNDQRTFSLKFFLAKQHITQYAFLVAI